MRLIRYLVWLVARGVLPLRYRIRVRGLERIRDLPGPVLILPNHPAYIDPVIVLTTVWPHLQPRPLLYENYFLNPLLYPMAKLLRAVLVPRPWSDSALRGSPAAGLSSEERHCRASRRRQCHSLAGRSYRARRLGTSGRRPVGRRYFAGRSPGAGRARPYPGSLGKPPQFRVFGLATAAAAHPAKKCRLPGQQSSFLNATACGRNNDRANQPK